MPIGASGEHAETRRIKKTNKKEENMGDEKRYDRQNKRSRTLRVACLTFFMLEMGKLHQNETMSIRHEPVIESSRKDR